MQIPFPAVIYCPELNKTLIEQHFQCRLRGQCDGLNSSQIKVNLNAVRAGCKACTYMDAEIDEIENVFEWELIRDDSRNNTYIEYLKHFFDASLIDQQSFCMSGRTDLQLRESIVHLGGFCYTINEQERIFDENM